MERSLYHFALINPLLRHLLMLAELPFRTDFTECVRGRVSSIRVTAYKHGIEAMNTMFGAQNVWAQTFIQWIIWFEWCAVRRVFIIWQFAYVIEVNGWTDKWNYVSHIIMFPRINEALHIEWRVTLAVNVWFRGTAADAAPREIWKNCCRHPRLHGNSINTSFVLNTLFVQHVVLEMVWWCPCSASIA